MKNYYKILEVDQEASQEIIEKAYKILVKKYHPDLQKNNEKSIAEEKIKKINEAYDILSDPIKRKKYDNKLIATNVSIEDYNLLLNENKHLKDELNNIKDKLSIFAQNYGNLTLHQKKYYTPQNNITQKVNNYKQPNYYNINSKKINDIIKKYLKILLSLIITFGIVFFILQIPFIKRIFSGLFDSNTFFITLIIILLLLFNSKR